MVNEYTEPLIRFEEKLDGILSLLASSVCLFPERTRRHDPLWPVRFPAYRPEQGVFPFPVETRNRDSVQLPGATGVLHWGMPN